MKNDGGQAFPSSNDVLPSAQRIAVVHPGMSLRDWFAGMDRSEPPEFSIKECLRLMGYPEGTSWNYLTHGPEWIAWWRFKVANAMIAERSKE